MTNRRIVNISMYPDRKWIKEIFESIYVAVMLFFILVSFYNNKLGVWHCVVIFLFNLVYAQIIKMVETKLKTSILFSFEVYSLLLLFVMFVYFQDVDSYFAHIILIIVNIIILGNWLYILDGKIYRLYKISICLLVCVYTVLGYVLMILSYNLFNIYLANSVVLVMLMPTGYVVKNYKRIVNYMDYKKNIISFLILSWLLSTFLYIKFGLLNGDKSALVIFIFISGFQYIVQSIFLIYYLKLNRISRVSLIYFIFIGIVIFVCRFYTIGLISLLLLNLSIFIDSNGYLKFKGKNNKRYYQSHIQQLKDESLYHKELASYLHDSILQDVIYLKRSINEEPITREKISEMLTDIILSIRMKMDNLSPMMYLDKTLYENIKMNIKQIQSRYVDKSIVIDLFCNEDIHLEFPYDELLIRIIKELINNIYKHTDSNFIEVKISVKKKELYISVLNDDGFLEQQALFESNRFSGLSQIYRVVDLLNGNIRIKNEDGVLISITIPIEGGNIIENSINRRP